MWLLKTELCFILKFLKSFYVLKIFALKFISEKKFLVKKYLLSRFFSYFEKI